MSSWQKGNGSIWPDELSETACLKLAVMAGIDEAIRRRHGTVVEAAVSAEVSPQQLARLRHGRHECLSVPWLLRLADHFGVKLTIDVAIADKPKM